jgi:WD40 repeat protein
MNLAQKAAQMAFRFFAVILAAVLTVPTVHAQLPATARTDSLGDPLPDGAIARLGTLRMRDSVGGMRFVKFSQDGKKAISHGWYDNQPMQVWDLASGKNLNHPLTKSSEGESFQLVMSSDRTVLAGIGSECIKLWEVATGKQIGEMALPAQLWKVATGKQIGNLAPPALSSTWRFKDNRTLVGIDAHGDMEVLDFTKQTRVKVWNCLSNFAKPKDVDSHLNCICSAAFSPDAQVLLAHLGHDIGFSRHGARYIQDGVVVAWDTTTGEEIWRKVSTDAGHGFLFSPDGKWFTQYAPANNPPEILFCETLTGKVSARLAIDEAKFGAAPRTSAGTVATLFPIAIAPDCKTVAIGAHDARLFLWDTGGQQTLKEINLPPENGRPSRPLVDFAPDGKSLLAALDACLQHIDLATGKQKLLWEGHRAAVTYLAYSPNGKSLASGTSYSDSQTGEILTWTLPAGKIANHSQAFVLWKTLALRALSSDHSMGLAAKPDGAFFVDLTSGKTLGKIQLESKSEFYSVGNFSPLGRFFVLQRDGRREACLFDIKSGEQICKMPVEWNNGNVVYNFDESNFACVNRAGLIHVISTATDKTVISLGRSGDFGGTNLAFSPDGRLLASYNSRTSEIVIWDVTRRKPLHSMSGEMTDGWSGWPLFSWSPDGRMLAEVGTKGRRVIRIWETATGNLRREFTGHEGDIYSLAFSPNGRVLASGSADTTILIWDIWGS